MNDLILNLLETAIKTTIIGVIGTFFVFLFKEKIKALIQYSIKYAFDKRLEDYKTKEIKRQKAILIADLLSEWISNPKDRKNLNKLTFEAFIWLPKETAMKLSDLLSLERGAPQIREVLAEVRMLILGESEVIDFNQIIIFPSKVEKKEGI